MRPRIIIIIIIYRLYTARRHAAECPRRGAASRDVLEIPTVEGSHLLHHVREAPDGSYTCRWCPRRVPWGNLPVLLQHVIDHGHHQSGGRRQQTDGVVPDHRADPDAARLRRELRETQAELGRLRALVARRTEAEGDDEERQPQADATFRQRLHLCRMCQRSFENRNLLSTHIRRIHHPDVVAQRREIPLRYELNQRFARTAILNYVLSPPGEAADYAWPDLDTLFRQDNAREIIIYYLLLNYNISVQLGVQVQLTKPVTGLDNAPSTVTSSFHFLLNRRRLFEHELQPTPGRPAGARIDEFLDEARIAMQQRLAHLEENGSGWCLVQVERVYVNIYDGTRTLDGRASVKKRQSELRSFLKQVLVNHERALELPLSTGQHCLLYCVAQYFQGGEFCPSKTLPQIFVRTRKTGDKKEEEEEEDALDAFIRTRGLVLPNGGDFKAPLSMALLKELEDLNRENLNFRINIHVLDASARTITPYQISEKPISTCAHSLDLLLLDLPNGGPSHYALITDLGLLRLRAVDASSGQLKKVGGSKTHVCRQCYARFGGEGTLLRHESGCFLSKETEDKDKDGDGWKQDLLSGGGQITMTPPAGSFRKFSDHHKTRPLPFMGVADFESAVREPGGEIDTPNRTAIHDQVPVSFGLAFIDTDTDEIVYQKMAASQTECMNLFFDAVDEAQKVLDKLINKYPNHNIDPRQSTRLRRAATACYLCKLDFTQTFEEEMAYGIQRKRAKTESSEKSGGGGVRAGRVVKGKPAKKKKDGCALPKTFRVLDHCHYTGAFLGVAHSSCNLLRQLRTRQIPIMVHNLSNFDQAFVVDHLRTLSKEDPERVRRLKPSGLVKNTQRFRVINLSSFKLVDSLSFINCSLDRAVKHLKAGNHEFKILKQSPLAATESGFDLCTRKGVFCYELLQDVEDFRRRTELPGQVDFYNALTKEACSDKDYAHAQLAFKTFDCKNMLDYLLAYNEIDILLLAEVVQAFRRVILGTFELDLLHYISLPSLSFDAFLKTSGVELELLSDKTLFQEIRSSIRGGLSFARERLVETQEERQIAYVDGKPN